MSIVGRHHCRRLLREKREERENEERREAEHRSLEATKKQSPNPFYAEVAKMRLDHAIELDDAHKRGERLNESGMPADERDRVIRQYFDNVPSKGETDENED